MMVKGAGSIPGGSNGNVGRRQVARSKVSTQTFEKNARKKFQDELKNRCTHNVKIYLKLANSERDQAKKYALIKKAGELIVLKNLISKYPKSFKLTSVDYSKEMYSDDKERFLCIKSLTFETGQGTHTIGKDYIEKYVNGFYHQLSTHTPTLSTKSRESIVDFDLDLKDTHFKKIPDNFTLTWKEEFSKSGFHYNYEYSQAVLRKYVDEERSLIKPKKVVVINDSNRDGKMKELKNKIKKEKDSLAQALNEDPQDDTSFKRMLKLMLLEYYLGVKDKRFSLSKLDYSDHSEGKLSDIESLTFKKKAGTDRIIKIEVENFEDIFKKFKQTYISTEGKKEVFKIFPFNEMRPFSSLNFDFVIRETRISDKISRGGKVAMGWISDLSKFKSPYQSTRSFASVLKSEQKSVDGGEASSSIPKEMELPRGVESGDGSDADPSGGEPSSLTPERRERFLRKVRSSGSGYDSDEDEVDLHSAKLFPVAGPERIAPSSPALGDRSPDSDSDAVSDAASESGLGAVAKQTEILPEADSSTPQTVSLTKAIKVTQNRLRKLEGDQPLNSAQKNTLIRLKLRMAILSSLEDLKGKPNVDVQIFMHEGKPPKGKSQINSIMLNGKEINLSKISLEKQKDSALNILCNSHSHLDGEIIVDNIEALSVTDDDSIERSKYSVQKYISYEEKPESSQKYINYEEKPEIVEIQREGSFAEQFLADSARSAHEALWVPDVSKDIKTKENLFNKLEEYNEANQGQGSSKYSTIHVFVKDGNKKPDFWSLINKNNGSKIHFGPSIKALNDLEDSEFSFEHKYVVFNEKKYAVVEKKVVEKKQVK